MNEGKVESEPNQAIKIDAAKLRALLRRYVTVDNDDYSKKGKLLVL